MIEVATTWINTLSARQRRSGVYSPPTSDTDSDRDRITWFYTPTDHGGLPMGQQSPAQQQLAMKLLATGLTLEGYVAAATIIGLENVLDRIEDFQVQWGRERGRDAGLYFVRVFGLPGRDRIWGWRFAGHHLSVNVLLVDGHVVSNCPFFLGADPAAAPLPGGSLLRPLGGIEDLARQFASTLTAGQRDRMQLLDRAVSDIVSGNRAQLRDGDEMIHMQDLWRGRFEDPHLADIVDQVDVRAETNSGFTADDHRLMSYSSIPKGLSGEALKPAQRELLHALVRAASAGPVPTASAASNWDDDTLSELHIAWGGRIDESGPVYFRLQAPRLFFEYDNTQRDANHAHSVLRDPANDFGFDTLRAHRARSKH
jgi:Protein of unknown function (DUF3500)